MALMKTYLSFGAGVNSTAILLMGGYDEAVFSDTGCERPETYEYLKMLISKGYEFTWLKVIFGGFDNLYDYCWNFEMVPPSYGAGRWCSVHFKREPIMEYSEKPCFHLIGYDYGEIHRVKETVEDDVVTRFPLIEEEMTRYDCEQLILKHGLPLPVKSGCYFCPQQQYNQWRSLRMNHPDLWCKAVALEDRNVEYQKRKGHEKIKYIDSNGKPLRIIANEAQGELFEEYKPPCYCGR